jgi:hypothetical protein
MSDRHLVSTEFGPVEVSPHEAELLNAHDAAHRNGRSLPALEEIEARCLLVIVRHEAFRRMREGLKHE